MARKEIVAPIINFEDLIREVRELKVILDADLARIYGVTTKRLNEQVKRNQERFPADFAFQLTAKETESLRSQFATSSGGNRSQIATGSAQGVKHEKDVLRSQIATSSSHGGRRYRPYAFTEHGAIMAANVLNSARAMQMSVFVVRAFLKMRAFLGDNRELAKQLAALEKELKQRLDIHEAAIVTILQRVMDIIDPPSPPPPAPAKPKIGFKP
jgi:ORF6N domain